MTFEGLLKTSKLHGNHVNAPAADTTVIIQFASTHNSGSQVLH